MVLVDATVLLDFVSSLAVLGLLVLGFSALAPALPSRWYVASGLGVFFGLVAGLQMSMPLSPTDGVIVDMRNVPVVLAGAFLGLRGLAVCVCITIGIRIGIGGVGVPAGIIGTVIAGTIGYGWSHLRQHLRSKDVVKLILLGLAMNLHMVSAFVAPAEIMRWYFTSAAPTVFILNVICVPAIGWLLLREQNVVVQTSRLSASAPYDPATRLLSLGAFSQEVAHLNASDTDNRVVGMMAVTLKNVAWLKRTWGEDAMAQVLGVARLRIGSVLGDQRPLGIDHQQRILVPVTATEMGDQRPLRHALRRSVSEAPAIVAGDISVPMSALVESFSLRKADSPERTLADIKRSTSARRGHGARRNRTGPGVPFSPEGPLPKGLCQRTYHRLFDETDAKMQRAIQQG